MTARVQNAHYKSVISILMKNVKNIRITLVKSENREVKFVYNVAAWQCPEGGESIGVGILVIYNP